MSETHLLNWSRRLERLAHGVRLARDHLEIGARGLVGLDAALLPIAQRAERNVIARGKIFLAQPKRAADDLRLRRALHALEIFGRKRLRVGIAERRTMALRIG